jgi:hypothetical protein
MTERLRNLSFLKEKCAENSATGESVMGGVFIAARQSSKQALCKIRKKILLGPPSGGKAAFFSKAKGSIRYLENFVKRAFAAIGGRQAGPIPIDKRSEAEYA